MPPTRGVRIKGLRETIRAFNNVEGDLSESTREALKKSAEPVRVASDRHALERISGLSRSPKWAEQRIVVSKRTALVYMAPSKRGARDASRKRPNLGTRLMDEAMQPALEENEEKVRHNVEAVLDYLGRKNGF